MVASTLSPEYCLLLFLLSFVLSSVAASGLNGISGADILRGGYWNWTEVDTMLVQSWMRTLWWLTVRRELLRSVNLCRLVRVNAHQTSGEAG